MCCQIYHSIARYSEINRWEFLIIITSTIYKGGSFQVPEKFALLKSITVTKMEMSAALVTYQKLPNNRV